MDARIKESLQLGTLNGLCELRKELLHRWCESGITLDGMEAAFDDYELMNDKYYQAMVAAHFGIKELIDKIGNILNKK